MRIAVSAMGSTNDEMISSMNRIAEAKAEIIELRLDFLTEKPDLERLLSHTAIPKIVNHRITTKLIVSYHNFYYTPENIDMITKYDKIAGTSADIIKIATFAKNLDDSIRMLNLISRTNDSKKKPLIGICMGEKGMITREWGPVYGGYLTFASIDDKTASAPGQISIARLRENWRNLKLDYSAR